MEANKDTVPTIESVITTPKGTIFDLKYSDRRARALVSVILEDGDKVYFVHSSKPNLLDVAKKRPGYLTKP